jgi:hypothetical protein
MSEEKFKKFTKEEAIKIAQSIGMDLSVYSIDEFIMGLTVEHGSIGQILRLSFFPHLSYLRINLYII